MSTTIKIPYLGAQSQPAPAASAIEYPIDLPGGIRVGWADRAAGPGAHSVGRPAVYAEIDGICASVTDDGLRVEQRVSGGLYPYADNAPDWVAHLSTIREMVIAKIAADRAARPDVQAACADYERIIASMSAEYARHYAQWQMDVASIARRFGRKTVQVSEQTVPGKCVVRSRRGKTLGYANVWDGRWRGTVERI